MLEVGSFLLLTFMLARMGDLEVAAHQLALQIIHFAFLPALAIGEAAAVLSGQAVGARQFFRVRGVGHAGFKLAGVYALFYKGSLDLYRPIRSPKADWPIYVGKAVPPGARKVTGKFG